MDRLLASLGFSKVRQRGSHLIYRHLDGRSTTVPQHGARVLGRPLLRTILREIEVSVEEYVQLLNDL
ncbi:type II toxin-antitoxin system HicA family toxin [bacterium]|nr:type II toxin-antitoxin system HicA family toxin [bacterium]